MADLISNIFGLIFFGTLIIETIQAMHDEICNIRETAWGDQSAPCYDEFEMLYINVAHGDSADSDYWLAGVRGGEDNDNS